METIPVKLEKNATQIKGSLNNFSVFGVNWDLGDPLGIGATEELAIADYKESWLLRRDEEIEVSIVKRETV